MLISLKFALAEQEYDQYVTFLQSQAHRYYPRLIKQHKWYQYAWVAGFIIIGFGILGATDSPNTVQTICIFSMFAWMLVMIMLIKLNTKAETLDSKLFIKRIFSPYECVIDQHVISSIFDDAQDIYQWQAFIELAETEHTFYLMTKEYTAVILPKRIFNNDQTKQLINLIEQHNIPHITYPVKTQQPAISPQ